jgi:ribonuclease III
VDVDAAVDVDALIARLGVEISDPELVDEALSHRSWCAEHPGNRSNERLEFLGDAVLGWAVADVAFRRYPDMSEGELTGVRKGVVNASTLSEIALELGLGEFLKLGKGESAAGGANKPSILSDAVEALIGAVYLDRGTEAAYEFVESLLTGRIGATAARLDELDYKSTLQELVAATARTAPVYVVSSSGPDHDKRFVAKVVVAGEVLGRGEGRSKRTAEQAAAASATMRLRAASPPGS